jgi:hypothetical protein
VSTFTATFYGQCPDCHLPIRPGDPVRYLDSEVLHDDCADDAEHRARRPDRVPCPFCFTFHTGECP